MKITMNYEPRTMNLSKGFTLIELLVFMGVFSIIIVILTQVYVSFLDAQREMEATSYVEQDGSFILARLAYDVGRAKSIDIPVNPGDQTSNLQLTIDESGVNRIFAYSLASNNLMLTDYISAEQLNNFNTTVSNLSVKRIGNSGGKNSLNIGFTLTSRTIKAGGSPEIKNYQVTAGLR